MRTFQAVFNDDVEGVFAISLVEDSAMEGEFIALKKQEPYKMQFAEVDKREFILAGLVLSPDKPVYRKEKGEEYNIVFSKETVKELCYAFTKNANNRNSTTEHEKKIEGVTFVENWIVRDSKIDTAVALGLDVKEGDWISVAKCDNKEIYDRALKGEFKGFSIEAMILRKEINLKANIMSEVKKEQRNFIDELKILLGIKKSKDVVKLGSVKSLEGDITFEYDGETPVIGAAVWVMAEDGSKVPVPGGNPPAEYPLEDGRVLIVAEEGIIGQVKEAVEENLETPATNPNSIISTVQEQIKSLTIKYDKHIKDNDKKIKELETNLSSLTDANKDLKTEVTELSKQPAAEKTIFVNEQVALNKNGRLLQKLRQ